MDPNDKFRRRAIRREKLNQDYPDDVSLTGLVVDHFPDIALRFASGMDSGAKRNLLLQLAPEDELDRLLGLDVCSASSDCVRGQLADADTNRPDEPCRRPALGSPIAGAQSSSQRKIIPPFVTIGTIVVMAILFGGIGFLWGRNAGQAPPGMLPIPIGVLGRFYVDINLVTVADYEVCVRAGACTPATTTHYPDQQDQAMSPIYNTLCTAALPDKANHPINCVDFEQAKTYCEFVGKRLPSVAEWERAAGPDKYPWGPEPPTPERVNACDRRCVEWARRLGHRWRIQPGTLCNVELVPWLGIPSEFLFEGDDGYETTAPVGSKPPNVYGLRDMTGSLRQWTTDERKKILKDGSALTQHVLKGGSWNELRPDHLSTPFRFHASPDIRSEMHGFRCVSSHPLPLAEQTKPRSIEP